MKLCLAQGRCTHPLPCSLHGTRVEPVAVVLTDYSWLVEPMGTGSTMLSLMRGEEIVETRLISVASRDGDAVVRGAMLADADLLPRRLAGVPYAERMG